MARMIVVAALGGLAAQVAGVAHADLIEEARLGVLAHNVEFLGAKNAGKEDGPSIEAQLTFASPDLFKIIGAPRPYVVGNLNVAGETSFAGVGAEWRIPLSANWTLEPGLGYVIHDGETENPFRRGTAQAARYGEETLLLGSRDLFRVSVGLGRSIGARTSVQAFYSHLSHGQILGSGVNQGLDQVGVRMGWRLGD